MELCFLLLHILFLGTVFTGVIYMSNCSQGSVSSETESTACKNHNVEQLGLATDPTSDAQAVKPKDIIVFVNLVDFCRLV